MVDFKNILIRDQGCCLDIDRNFKENSVMVVIEMNFTLS